MGVYGTSLKKTHGIKIGANFSATGVQPIVNWLSREKQIHNCLLGWAFVSTM